MDMRAKINRITKYSALAVAWIGKTVILFALVAVLGFTQNLYGIDVRLSPKAPMVQIQVIVFDSLPRVSWRKLVNFTKGLFHAGSSHEQACRESQKQDVAQDPA